MTLDDRTLDQRLAALPRRAEPEAYSWQAIEARLAPRRARWPSGFAAGLAVAASLAIALLVVRPLDVAPPGVGALVISAEIQAMQNQVNWDDAPRIDVINGGLSSAWDENQQAIAELERALARNPDNTMLIDFLAQARLRQSELIHQATVGGTVAQTWSL